MFPFYDPGIDPNEFTYDGCRRMTSPSPDPCYYFRIRHYKNGICPTMQSFITDYLEQIHPSCTLVPLLYRPTDKCNDEGGKSEQWKLKMADSVVNNSCQPMKMLHMCRVDVCVGSRSLAIQRSSSTEVSRKIRSVITSEIKLLQVHISG